MEFYKMHGTGNDFILLDNRRGEFPRQGSALIQRMCARRTGIGADGLLLLEKDEQVDFSVRYYNADGGPARMCGNGARCAVWLAHRLGLCGVDVRFRLWDQFYRARILDERRVEVEMGPVHWKYPEASLQEVPDAPREGRPLGMLQAGVPHLVLEAQVPLEEVDFIALARFWRFHALFAPEGTNVNLIRPLEPGKLRVRVYERGVEAETLSCGSGAVACAVAAAGKYGWSSPVQVVSQGGLLEVDFLPRGEQTRLRGAVTLVFRGRWLHNS